MSAASPAAEKPAAPKTKSRRVRTPTVIQMEAVECGAAALGIILAYHRKWVPLEELRKACGVSRDGSRASNVLKAGRSYGMEAKGFQMEAAKLRELKTPFIVFWNFHHFLVVEGFKGDTVYLNDPGSGPRKVKFQDFDNSYTGVVLTFSPNEDFTPGGEKPSVFHGLGERLEGGRAALALVFLASLLLIVPGLASPAFMRVFVDKVLNQGLTGWTLSLLGVMALAAAATWCLTLLQQHYLLRLETRMALQSSARFVRHVLRLPVDFFTQRQPADVSSRVQANDTVAQLLSRDLATSLISGLLVVFYAVFLFSYDVWLTLIGIGMAALNIVVLQVVSRARKDATTKLRQDRGRLIGTTYNGLQLIETLKATGTENDFFGRWAGFQTKVSNGQQKLGVPTQVLAVVPPLLASLNAALILWIGSNRAIEGAITIGVLVAFQGLLNNFTRPVQQLTQLGQKLQDVAADINRLGDVERYPVAKAFQGDADDEGTRLDGYLALEEITFGYSPLADPLIRDFSLHIEPGHRVALVGGSGSGKSTIARLVAGLHEPWTGRILLDGRPREEVSRHVLGTSLAVVDQDIFLFEGTVRENLTLWDDTVSDDVLIQALKDALIYDDIMARPGGLNGLISEGGRNLSGGQRQRLEIARALATDPRILILDEATSALDTETEKAIDDNLRRRGCTCVIVAHRLSTIRDADEIIVLQFGKVMQRGTHDELLLDKDGLYAQLIGAE
mgnify:CR=1 FL=1